MNGYLVDTNILSELTNPTSATQVEAFLRLSKDRIFVSVFSIGEIRKGIAFLPTSNRRRLLKIGSIMKSCRGSRTVFCPSRSPLPSAEVNYPLSQMRGVDLGRS